MLSPVTFLYTYTMSQATSFIYIFIHQYIVGCILKI